MNVGRYVWGSIVVFVYLFLIEYVFHGLIMAGYYQQAPQMLRPESAMNTYFSSMILGFLVFAFGFCFIFTKGYEGKGWMEGLRYGLYVAITFALGTSLINYAVYPIPGSWMVGWFIGYPIILMIAGIIFAAIYKPKSAAA